VLPIGSTILPRVSGYVQKPKFTMKPVKFKRTPLLYGASFLLDVIGSNLMFHCRALERHRSARPVSVGVAIRARFPSLDS